MSKNFKHQSYRPFSNVFNRRSSAFEEVPRTHEYASDILTAQDEMFKNHFKAKKSPRALPLPNDALFESTKALPSDNRTTPQPSTSPLGTGAEISAPVPRPSSPFKGSQSTSNVDNPKPSSMQLVEDHLLSKVFIKRLYGAVYLFNGKYYAPLTEQDFSILVRRESDNGIISLLKTYSAFKDAYRFLMSNPDIEFRDYDKMNIRFRTVIAFKNTLLDARTGETFTHDPDYPVFFGTNANYIKFPDDTPYWDQFVQSISMGDAQTVRLIHQMLGYLLLQGNDGKVFFVLATAPNSGKSLLGQFISSLFPNEYVAHNAINDFSGKFSLGSLWKTIINVSMDLPQSTLNADTVSLIKTITGDTLITTEEKYMPRSTALNRCKLVFGTNSRISISLPDTAFWERLIIVPFLHEIPRNERIYDLLEHLLDEKDHILSKCVPYVKELIKQNYDFTIPAASMQMKAEWCANTSNTIESFFAKHCRIITNGENCTKIPVQEMFDKYCSYCEEFQLPLSVTDCKQFSTIVSKLYPALCKHKHRMDGHKSPISVFTNLQYYN